MEVLGKKNVWRKDLGKETSFVLDPCPHKGDDTWHLIVGWSAVPDVEQVPGELPHPRTIRGRVPVSGLQTAASGAVRPGFVPGTLATSQTSVSQSIRWVPALPC